MKPAGGSNELNWPEVKTWRKAVRDELLAARLAMPSAARAQRTSAIISNLRPLLTDLTQPISAYWPLKGEPDLRPLMHELDNVGVVLALPVALRLGLPMTFRPWHPQAAMERGLWNIPIPATRQELRPRLVLAPLLAYDSAGYRLGFGGGFFDLTLAGINPRPLAIGIGYANGQIATVHPQPHDVPMDLIVTDEGVFRAPEGELQRFDIADAKHYAAAIAAERGVLREPPSLAACASPPCAAHEFPDYFEPRMSADELTALLNTLLEAERAGAQVLAMFLADYADAPQAQATLRAVYRDEAHNCAAIIDALRTLGCTVSSATGDFVGKALAIEGRCERLKFLNRGQGWVAKKIGAALPQLPPSPLRDTLAEMQTSHLRNIEICEDLVTALTPGSRGLA